MAAKRKPSAKPDADLTCPYCGKGFVRPKSFASHLCERKQRHLDRDERHVKLGLVAFQRFYAVAMRGRKAPDHDTFMASQFYKAFVRFGRHLLDINAVSPNAFMDFLIKGGVPIDDWTNQGVYTTYLREMNKRESADAALERNFYLMQQWAIDTELPWTDYFRKIPAPLAVAQIRAGRISPWVLYTASSGLELLQRFTPEQMDLVQEAIDPEFWVNKLGQHADEVDVIRAALDTVGL